MISSSGMTGLISFFGEVKADLDENVEDDEADGRDRAAAEDEDTKGGAA